MDDTKKQDSTEMKQRDLNEKETEQVVGGIDWGIGFPASPAPIVTPGDKTEMPSS